MLRKDAEGERVMPEVDAALAKGRPPVSLVEPDEEVDVNLTEEQAYKFLGMEEVEGDRLLSQKKIDDYKKEMAGGTFQWKDVTLKVARFKGQWYRYNGQHTCYARIELGHPNWGPTVRLHIFKPKTEEDFHKLYGIVDPQKIARSNGQVMTSQLCWLDGFKGLPKKIYGVLGGGIGYWLKGEKGAMDSMDRATLIGEEHKTLALRVVHALGRPAIDTNFMVRSVVAAAMFATFAKAPAKAAEFWEAVKTGANLDARDPRKSCHDFLVRTKIGAKGVGQLYNLGFEECYATLIRWWNAWRKGETPKSVQVRRKVGGEYVRPEPL